jgi:uncharacterized protein
MREGPKSSEMCRETPFHVMTMPIGPACNLDCEYCYYLEKSELYPEKANFRMSEDTLEEFIKQYIEAQPGPQVTFAWQGGEPTLIGVDFYREVVNLQEEHAPADKQIVNTLQTNGTRLDDEWGRFLATHDFLVGISIDGPRELHNQYRQTRAGGPVFEEVMTGLSVLQEHGVEYNVLCVVNRYNSQYPLHVYEFFKNQDIEWLQFIPLVEMPETTDAKPASVDTTHEPNAALDDLGVPTDQPTYDWVRERGDPANESDDNYHAVLDTAREAPVTNRSVDPEAYAEFMCAIFEEWVRNDVGEISVRLFDQSIQVALGGEASYCILRETCGDQVAMEHNGDIYACDHFVDPGFHLGNIHETHLMELLDSEEQRQFGQYKREGLPPRCRECDVRAFCHGGCPKNRHLKTPGDEAGLNYLCAGYRQFFTYIQPYLDIFEKTVRENKPLPFVMDGVAVLDERAASS